MIDHIKKILSDISAVTGLQIALYSGNLAYLCSCGTMSSICVQLRKDPHFLEQCKQCSKHGQSVCSKTNSTYIYKCHIGFTEIIIPIFENGVIIGYIYTGQILHHNDVADIKAKLKTYAKFCDINVDILYNKLDKVPVLTQEYIDSCLKVIGMCIPYLELSRLVKNNPQITHKRFKNYLDYNYTRNLSSKHLCEVMHISRSQLYNISIKTLGMSSSEYILRKRIEASKTYLETHNINISDIAERVGFDNANYFTRMFKKHTGLTPSEYRNQKRPAK